MGDCFVEQFLFGFFYIFGVCLLYTEASERDFRIGNSDNQVEKIMTNTFHRKGNLVFLLCLPIMMINKKAASV